MSDEETTEPTQTEEEKFEEIERQYLAGEINEEGEVVQEATKEDVAPSEEKPAILENKRLREKNRELNEGLEDMQRQVKELSEKMSSQSTEEKPSKIKTASVEELIEAETTLEQQLFQAYQGDDQEKVQRIIEAKKAVKLELTSRPALQVNQQQEEDLANSQWKSLESAVLEAIPDVKDPSSEIYKNAEQFAQENQALMKRLGSASGLVALAQALTVSTPKGKAGKAAVQNVVKEVEKITEGSVSETPPAGGAKKAPPVNYASMTDAEFESMFDNMKQGNVPIPSATG